MSLAETASQGPSHEVQAQSPAHDCHGEKFKLDIEGVVHDWPVKTITTEQIAELGCWDPSAGVIEIDADNNERTLAPGEVIELKPGVGFSKKVRWKRG